jgi:5-methylcytosine-specific restriction protein B
MAADGVDRYTVEKVQDFLPHPLETKPDIATEAIKGAVSEEVIEILIKDNELDRQHDGDRGLGPVRRAVLESDLASPSLKREVATRGDDTKDYDVLVPDTVQRSAYEAVRAGKPVVLYGPTGTGKTTFAKQLALNTGVGYTLETASPSWTRQDIIGRVAPEYSEDEVGYQKEPGCVSEAVLRARDFGNPYTVIIDELTRADISKIFGPLYTAIENPHQTIFETDDGRTVELDPQVNIIATMNMSDRTVNELDNAITRRFAMIEISEYETTDREDLFARFAAEHLNETSVDNGALQDLFQTDYTHLNGVDLEHSSRELDSPTGILQFGPMHYADVARFLGTATADDGRYADSPELAVGEAFRTYITPRVLNAATYSQLRDLIEHYEALDDAYDFDLSRAAALIQGELDAEEQRMGK